MSDSIKESVRVLLSGAIDYAGLFPPAKLSMPEAVINYATYRNSNYSWMLGRFICPVGRLEEFLESARDFFPRDKAGAWSLAVLGGDDVEGTVATARKFNEENSKGAVIDVLELKADDPDLIEGTASYIPDNMTAYFEIPNGENLAELISAIAISKTRAKIRTGGVTSDLFPSSREVIRFVRTCMAANTPFKATAGLHHPIRCFKPLTYEPKSPKGTMHGFVNLFLATGFAREGISAELLEEVMEEEFEEVFEFDDNGITWQKEKALNIYQIESLRAKGINSFGSCSFDEPISDLQEIGLL